MSSTPSLLIALPEKNRQKHSLFELNSNAVAEWKKNLPQANFGETSRQLYQALTELNHMPCKAKLRLDILAQISPLVHHVNGGLSQHFSNQPVVLPAKARKIVELADTLNRQLALAYCQAFVDLESSRWPMKPRDAMARALFEALNEFACILLRSYKLYRQPPTGFWHTLHQIYSAAKQHKIEKHPVTDQRNTQSTIELSYLRPIMLANSRTQQMPIRYIDQVFYGLRFWCAVITVRSAEQENCTFLIDTQADAAPTYRELFSNEIGPEIIGLNMGRLTLTPSSLRDMVSGDSANQLHLPDLVLTQLCAAWSAAAVRNEERIPCHENTLVAVGMNASHYFIADQTDFRHFKYEDLPSNKKAAEPTNAATTVRKDVWGSNGSEDTRDEEHGLSKPAAAFNKSVVQIENIDYSLPLSEKEIVKQRTQYAFQQAITLDCSTNGYRLEWPECPQLNVRTGEVIAISADENDAWRLGAVRWLRNSDNSHQLGVKVFANAATPCSVRRVQSGLAVGEFQRGFLLPPDNTDDEPRLLTTDTTSLSEHTTVEIQHNAETMRVKLTQVLDSSNAFKLFRYEGSHKPLQAKDIAGDDGPDNGNEFKSLWSEL